MTITRVNHTGISVSDMDRSLTFYRDLLELDVIFDSDVPGNERLSSVVGMANARGRVVWLRAGDTMIELWQWDNPVGRALASDYNPSDKGVTHFALQTDNVDELYRKVTDAGYHANTTGETLKANNLRILKDGEIIEILEDRATDEWLRELTEASMAARAKEAE